MAKNKTPNRVAGGGSPKPQTRNASTTQNSQAKPIKSSTPPITLKPELSKASIKPIGTIQAPKLGIKKEIEKKRAPVQFVFERQNYQWMFIGIGVLILGFILMSGTTDIMSPIKIILAPFIVLSGFAIEFYAILLNPNKNL